MKISANDIRSGDVIIINSDLYKVEKLPDHIKPGKGPAYVQVIFKNLNTGNKLEKRFKSTIMVEKAYIETKKLQYLYQEQEEVVLMDGETFEQFTFSSNLLGKKVYLLQEGMVVDAYIFEDNIIDIKLPDVVEVKILDTSPSIKLSSSNSSFKKAKINGEINIDVPNYLTSGEKVVIKSDNLVFVKKAKS